MSKASGAGMIFIGLMLIAVAIVGIGGFLDLSGLAVSGSLLKEDWNSLANWNTAAFPGICKIVSGELYMNPGTGLSDRSFCERISVPTIPSQFTVEWRFRVTTWSGYPYMLVQFYTGSNFVAIELMQDGVRCEVSPKNYVLKTFTPTDSQNHVWTMVVDQTAKNLKLYRDTTLVAEWTEMYSVATTQQICYGMVSSAASSTNSYTDYFYVDTGLIPPDGFGPPPENGYITLYTKYSSDGGVSWFNAPNVQVTVQRSGVYYATWATDSNGKYGPEAVTPGTYTFSASCSTQSDSETITIAAGESKSVTLGFSSGGGEPPPGEPPPDGQDWWQKIRDFLDDSMTRTIMLLGGVGLVGVGAIMIFSGPKERYYVPQYSPRW